MINLIVRKKISGEYLKNVETEKKMKYLVLLLSVWLFGCAAKKTNEAPTMVLTGTPEKRGDAQMVASMTAGVMFAYMGDLTGRTQDPIDYIMSDRSAAAEDGRHLRRCVKEY